MGVCWDGIFMWGFFTRFSWGGKWGERGGGRGWERNFWAVV